jgi:hypothetical protein
MALIRQIRVKWITNRGPLKTNAPPDKMAEIQLSGGDESF